MAYDRYDTRRDRGRYTENDRGRSDDRGFFDRASDEVASWFGDDEAQRRRREDERMNRDHDRDRDRYAIGGWGERDADRGRYAYGGRDFDRERNRSLGRDWDRNDHERSSRPMNWASSEREYGSGQGDYGRRAGSDRGYGSSAYGGAFTGSDYERSDYGRSESPWGRDDYRRTSYAGSARQNDPHYDSWRQRQLEELDRDYDEYHRERQQRFEQDFGTWREQRQQKRSMLPKIREHMDVMGSDGETVGKVDCVKRDRIVLTKSDSEDNRHHSISCSMIDAVEGDQVRLDTTAEEAKNRWRDEERGGREDDEHVNLERSFSGTYS